MDASSNFVGYSLSALCFTALLSGPVYGVITDKTKKSKVVLVVANIIAVVGKFIYCCTCSMSYILIVNCICHVLYVHLYTVPCIKFVTASALFIITSI